MCIRDRKKRVDPALVLWSAAIVLFAGAFFLGRATLRGLLLETQRTAPEMCIRDRTRPLRCAAASFQSVKKLLFSYFV